MPYYLTAEGERIDVSGFDGDAKGVYEGMRQDYETDRYDHWASFHQYWERQVVSEAQRTVGERWTEHPLRKIELDLATTVGVKHDQLTGTKRELSDIFID